MAVQPEAHAFCPEMFGACFQVPISDISFRVSTCPKTQSCNAHDLGLALMACLCLQHCMRLIQRMGSCYQRQTWLIGMMTGILHAPAGMLHAKRLRKAEFNLT